MKINFYRVITILVMLAVSSAAFAYIFDGKDVKIEYWTGSGENEAICVIDFGPAYFAFGYRWDGASTGFDMIQAIANNGDVELDLQNFGFGVFVNGITYNGYSKIGYGGGEDWWHYWTSTDGSEWEISWVGASARSLGNGEWDGWRYGSDEAPRIPLVPEPSTIAACLSMFAAAFSLRKRL